MNHKFLCAITTEDRSDTVNLTLLNGQNSIDIPALFANCLAQGPILAIQVRTKSLPIRLRLVLACFVFAKDTVQSLLTFQSGSIFYKPEPRR